jgi:hypothetical protein
MIFTDQGSRAYDKYNKKKRQAQKWPDTNGIPYVIYKAQSNYSFKSFFCRNIYFIVVVKINLLY